MLRTPLKREREKRGLSTRAVADAVGIDQSQLNRVENGIKHASRRLADQLSKYFDGALTRDQILFPEYYPEAPTKPSPRSIPQLQKAS